MKAAAITLVFALLLAPGSAVDLSPVTRVVELLKALSAQTEKEGKVEENLYEEYVCWGKTIIDQKTASNAAANSRINELEAYIADLESGRVELTSERTDLEKEIAGLMADMEEATALRNKEHADFLDAEDEMKKAVAALKSAIETLDTATKDHKEGVLLAVRASLHGAAENGGMATLAEHQESLKQAVQLGKQFLDKADANFLQRVLMGDVPKVDWKKLNRKATFKMSYKARSFKIQEVLAKMHQTFTSNLKDATDAEAKAKGEYDSLTTSKQGQLDAAQGALTKMDSENGAKGMSKQDSQDEVDALKQQVADDTKFMDQTKKALADKKASWKVRSDLRAGEIAAISKAISILHNDDARDLFKKSFDSQFLQVSQTATRAMTQRAESAAAVIQDVARRTGDRRLLALVSAAPFKSVKGQFDPILRAIDRMIATLKSEEEQDLKIKQTCEEDRMADTREAAVTSRDIDEKTDHINKLTTEIAQCEKTIEELKAEHQKTVDALAKAKQMRADENTSWKQTDADDKAAAETVMNAKNVLEGFYKDNNLSLLQKDAPPPPPDTWEGDYGGKTGESQGIIAIMEMVHEDIVKDRADAKADEDASQTEFENFETDSKNKMKELKAEEQATNKQMGAAETDKTNTEKERRTQKGKLNAVLNKISDINPNCEYYEVNYPMRLKNRQIEIDGLDKAKAILKGGAFNAGPDPNREMNVGDAFLQKKA